MPYWLWDDCEDTVTEIPDAPDIDLLAKNFADERSHHEHYSLEAYYAVQDAYRAGWKACEDHYEGR